MTAGARSFINDIIFTSGAQNIFADIDEEVDDTLNSLYKSTIDINSLKKQNII